MKIEIVRYILILIFLIFDNTVYAQLKFENYIINENISAWKTQYTFSYNFKNTGDSDINIISVDVSCKCTVVDDVKKCYVSGESGKIEGVLYLENRYGKQENEIILKTDRLIDPNIKLSLNLQKDSPLKMIPRMHVWKQGADTKKKIVRLILLQETDELEISQKSEKGIFHAESSKENNDSTYSNILTIYPLNTTSSISDRLKIRLKHGTLYKDYYVNLLVK